VIPGALRGRRTMHPKMLVIGLVLFGLPFQALGQATQPFGAKDIQTITKTAKSNEIRFKRDYKGKPFTANLPVNRISENFLFKDRYTATFGSNMLGNNVTCEVRDQPTIELMMDWDKGQKVTVSGTIDDTLLGDIKLKDCQYDPNPTKK
jgi:hypothetical protein